MTSTRSSGTAIAGDLLDVLYPLVRRLRAVRTLSPGKSGILNHLKVHGAATGSELAAAINVSPQAVSLGTHDLEALAYIERVPDAEDRRKTRFSITSAGIARLKEERRLAEDWVSRKAADSLTEAEQLALLSAIPVLRKIGMVRADG